MLITENYFSLWWWSVLLLWGGNLSVNRLRCWATPVRADQQKAVCSGVLSKHRANPPHVVASLTTPLPPQINTYHVKPHLLLWPLTSTPFLTSFQGKMVYRLYFKHKGRKDVFYLRTHSTHFYDWLCGIRHMVKDHSDNERINQLPSFYGIL